MQASNGLLVGSPARSYTESKIRNLKLFTEINNNGSPMQSPRIPKPNGLRNLSILPGDPYSQFFKPFRNEINIESSLTSNELESLGFRIEVLLIS